jgi:transcriptional regulator with XRE-family HTH domain
MKKNNDLLKDLHIGSIIKEIALQKGVSSKRIATLINYDQHNADKIFKMDDMNIEDVVRISCLLEYNILDLFAKKYLPHLPYTVNHIKSESYLIKIDMRTLRITTNEPINNYDFLKEIHIGQYIKEVAKRKDWYEQEVANKLGCSQGSIRFLYKHKNLKVKTLIKISNALQYHFIAEVYLSRMLIVSLTDKFDGCIILLNSQQIRILNPKDNTTSVFFFFFNDKK